jgi:hypothetical protein
MLSEKLSLQIEAVNAIYKAVYGELSGPQETACRLEGTARIPQATRRGLSPEDSGVPTA